MAGYGYFLELPNAAKLLQNHSDLNYPSFRTKSLIRLQQQQDGSDMFNSSNTEPVPEEFDMPASDWPESIS